MNIIKYKCFACSEDFEKWQQDNPTARIYIVAPVINNIDFNFHPEDPVAANQKAQGITSIAVFVTYTITPMAGGQADAV